jgi:hypothetical protein
MNPSDFPGQDRLTQLPPGLHFLSLYQRLRWMATDRVRPLLFRRLLSPHPAPPTPESSLACPARTGFTAALPGSSPLPWPSLSLTSSALPCSPFRANISTLQDSLHVTGCGFAPLPQGDTTLPWPDRQDRQHSQSPGCTGCLLRGPLAVTTTGLPPVSRRQLPGHTSGQLGEDLSGI